MKRYISQDLRDLARSKHSLMRQEFGEEAKNIVYDAKQITPYQSGQLRDSIQAFVSGSPRYPGIIATASAINENTGYDYAKIQHDNPSYQHEPPTQYRYLKKPVDEAANRLMEKL